MNSYVEWKGWQPSSFGTFAADEDIYFSNELKTLGFASVCGLAIGEIGFGNGSFAGWARAKGARWIGCEAIPILRITAKQAGFDVIAPDSGFANACGSDALDLIVAFDVFEHMTLDAISHFLIDAHRALRLGGFLLFRVPSGDSPFSGAAYRGDVTHRTLLGSSAAKQLAMAAHLQVVQIRSPAFPVLGLGVTRALRRATTRAVQELVFWFIGRVLMGNSNVVLSPNMTVVLRKDDRAS